jgi:hypothetical protein
MRKPWSEPTARPNVDTAAVPATPKRTTTRDPWNSPAAHVAAINAASPRARRRWIPLRRHFLKGWGVNAKNR